MNAIMRKTPAEHAERAGLVPFGWQPFDNLHKEIDRLFEEFDGGYRRPSSWRRMFGFEPFWHHERSFGTVPAVDVTEKDDAFEIAAELPGLDENDIEVRFTDGMLTIKGEKKEESEEKKKDFYLAERRYGSFERTFPVPEGVDTDKIEATFKKGVLTLMLPKKPEAVHPEKKISVKAA